MIDRDTPIRLADIIPLAFPHGGMTVSGLRREARRGNLTIIRMAGKDFTTLNHIAEMMERCRVAPSDPATSKSTKGEPPPDRDAALTAAHAIIDRLRNKDTPA